MSSGTRVRVEGVGKRYGGVAALAGLDLELESGITGLLGPNGAGKTTLIRILATLLAPSAGEVRVNGWQASNIHDRVEIRRRLGYLPQDLGLYPRFTVFEFVDYLAILKELDDVADRHRRVRSALAAVELEDLAGRKIRTLSGGMRRRVGIAQAIVADPQLVLLDEPTTGLDPEQRMRFRQLLAGLGERRTVLLSTHLVEDVAAVCTRVVVLFQGRVRFCGTPTELRRLADGQVWSSPEEGRGAVSSWRTETGAYRVLGPQPAASHRGGRLPAGLRPLPPGRGRMTGALARIEAGHLARSPLLLMGLALGVAVGGWVGLAVGRLSGSRMVSVLAAPLWVGLYLAVAQDARLALSVQNLSPVLGLYNRSAAYGFLPDPLWPHLGYLLGLTLLVGTLVLAVASRGGGRRTPPRPPLAAAAAGLLLAGASGARLLALPDGLVVLGPDRASWQPVEDDINPLGSWAPPSPGWSFPPDGRARTCAGDAAMTVCVYPAYGQRLAREIHAVVAPVAGPLAGLPGVPARVRMVPVGGGSCRGAEVQIAEMRVREPSTISDEQIRSNYLGDYLHCAVGPLLGELGPVGEAREAVARWALLTGGAMTRQQLQERGNHPGGPSPATVEAALAMAALPTDQVRAELAPVWERLRAGTLPLSELPGARP